MDYFLLKSSLNICSEQSTLFPLPYPVFSALSEMQILSPPARQLSRNFSYTGLYANHLVQFHQIMLKPKLYERSNLMNFSRMQIHGRLEHSFSSGH